MSIMPRPGRRALSRPVRDEAVGAGEPPLSSR